MNDEDAFWTLAETNLKAGRIRLILIADWIPQELERWYSHKEPLDDETLRNELREMLNKIPGVNITKDQINKRPNIDLEVFKNVENLKELKKCFEWYIEKVKSLGK